MGNVNQNITVKKDWLPTRKNDWTLANPWRWLAAGLVFAIWSWLWTVACGDNASDYRVIVLALGLLLGSVGVWLRWNNRQILQLHSWRIPLALLLGCLFALLGLGVSVLFVMSFFVDASYGLKSAPLFLVWISTAPPCFFAARRCLNRDPAERIDRDAEEEVALAFVVMAGICLIGSYTLYLGDDPTDWDTMRMFLRVISAVSLYASALTLVSTGLRRLMLSMLFTLHFAGISTAALSAPPAPWIVQQAWMRLFRPYLEFVYLNNAYHFYAPEPGPSSYLWFRIIYESPDGKSEDGAWYKIPQLDESGRIQHPVALDYQRFLSLTEAVAHPDPLPPEYQRANTTQQWGPNPFYSKRLNLVPMPNEPVVVGREKAHQLRIPLHPALPYLQQVYIPNDRSFRLLSSYARFVARKFAVHPDPEKSDWTFKSVKIYRVVHWIPPVQWFLNKIQPTDPELYRPFFVGKFDADGARQVDQDPYLFWLLPSIRDQMNDPDSQIRDYARLHAGDPNWIRRGSDQHWVRSGEEDPRP